MSQKPASVLVIAVIGIVTSGFALLFTPCGVLLFFKPLTPNPLLEEMAKNHIYAAITLFSYFINFILSLILMVLSIASLKLISWARAGMMLYACIVIVWAFFSTAVTFIYVMPHMAHILSTQFPAMHAALFVGIAAGILGFFYMLALPVAILICFSRTSVVNAFKGIFPAANTNFPVEHPAPSAPSTNPLPPAN